MTDNTSSPGDFSASVFSYATTAWSSSSIAAPVPATTTLSTSSFTSLTAASTARASIATPSMLTSPRTRTRTSPTATSTTFIVPLPTLIVSLLSSTRSFYLHLPPTSFQGPLSFAHQQAPPPVTTSSTSTSSRLSTSGGSSKRKRAAVALTSDLAISNDDPRPFKAAKLENVAHVPSSSSTSSLPSSSSSIPSSHPPTINNSTGVQLPPEVLLLLGETLDRPELCKVMRVSKEWHNTMYMLLYDRIDQQQWKSDHFPLLLKENERKADVIALRRRVREVTWADFYNHRVDSRRLAMLLRTFSNVRELTIITRAFPLSREFLGFLQDGQAMPNIKVMRLHLHRPFQGQDALSIRTAIGSVSRLDELSVDGPWFRDESNEELNSDPSVWQLRRLQLPRWSPNILQRCPELRVLVLASNPDMVQETNIAPFQGCSKLEELRFASRTGFEVRAFGPVLLSSKTLTTLTIDHLPQDQFSRLGLFANAAYAPSLKRLELGSLPLPNNITHGSDQNALSFRDQAMLVNILRTHSELQSFILRGVTIDGHSFFTLFEGGQSVASCPCPQLKELWLELRAAPLMEMVPAALDTFFTRIFSQIGRMTGLRTLTLKSTNLRVSSDAGFLLLREATELKKLALSDPNRRVWTSVEMQLLMMVAPHLKSLDLSPVSNQGNINGWLRLNGKAHLIK
ncbi:hypothetical protein BG015_003173 [Linnemannia schmuckeri]|uniref:F-box domain-containing protein n=1 Tax=Linnemannia schmuckeri TaxID=64567 RepID=A0A9P5RR28_9FUNG|nr:hypothetical protein BG015_003173 [Linnemannia schmuckeri]